LYKIINGETIVQEVLDETANF